MNTPDPRRAELAERLRKTNDALRELIKDEVDDPSVGITGWTSLHQLVADNEALAHQLAMPSPPEPPASPPPANVTPPEWAEWMDALRYAVKRWEHNLYLRFTNADYNHDDAMAKIEVITAKANEALANVSAHAPAAAPDERVERLREALEQAVSAHECGIGTGDDDELIVMDGSWFTDAQAALAESRK